MRKGRTLRLRWRLAVPLAAAFAALWLGTMVLFTLAAREELEGQVDLQYQYARETLNEHLGYYENNLANGLGAEAASILRENLSGSVYGLTDIAQGGMAYLVRDEDGTVVRSQLTFGYGHEDGVDQGQRWYLEFDSGLDDQGQLELASWIQEHRRSYGFELYPRDSWYGEAVEESDRDSYSLCDGTYARITGLPQPGYTISVQKIELVHPDGSVELMAETDTQGEDSVVLELTFLRVTSVLLTGWSSVPSSNTLEIETMELRLSNFRQAQTILDRELAGEDRSVQTRGGRLVGGSDGVILRYVAGQCDVTAAAIERERWLYGSTFVLLVLVVLLLSKHLSKKVTAPVEALGQAAQGGRCQTDGPISELNALAAAFNAAQDQLSGQLERERGFTRAAAHELKTPLAILRTHAEALEEDIAPEKRQAYLGVIVDECDRMSALVGSLLELSRLEAGYPLHRESTELSALVKGVWEPLALSLEQKHVSLVLDLEELWLEVDRERLQEAADNLASNALRHCSPGGTIRVSLKAEGERAVLTVYNDGPPVPQEDLPHLFEPFYRGDKSRGRESGGTGLGLAIARAAALAHNGSCGVENTGGGVAFQLILPLS